MQCTIETMAEVRQVCRAARDFCYALGAQRKEHAINSCGCVVCYTYRQLVTLNKKFILLHEEQLAEGLRE